MESLEQDIESSDPVCPISEHDLEGLELDLRRLRVRNVLTELSSLLSEKKELFKKAVALASDDFSRGQAITTFMLFLIERSKAQKLSSFELISSEFISSKLDKFEYSKVEQVELKKAINVSWIVINRFIEIDVREREISQTGIVNDFYSDDEIYFSD